VSGAADKLARTRLAIIEHVWRRKHGDHPDEVQQAAASMRQEARAEGAAKRTFEHARERGAGWFGSAKRAASVWWRHHPAHLGLEVATPLLSAYAARRPVVYLGAAAALGAVIVVTRPWRLVSATSLVIAILKSSQLSNVVMSALSAADLDAEPPYR
jgi:hypothetical protein